MCQFKEKFDKYACVNDSISVDIDGITFTARIVFDDQSSIDDYDCHNTDPSVSGCDDDEWFYCGVVISATKNDTEISDHVASLWSIECNYPNSDNSYLTEAANELLNEAIEPAKAGLADMIEKLSA